MYVCMYVCYLCVCVTPQSQWVSPATPAQVRERMRGSRRVLRVCGLVSWRVTGCAGFVGFDSGARVQVAVLRAGELLYLPPFWFHRVTAANKNHLPISVNVWRDAEEQVDDPHHSATKVSTHTPTHTLTRPLTHHPCRPHGARFGTPVSPSGATGWPTWQAVCCGFCSTPRGLRLANYALSAMATPRV